MPSLEAGKRETFQKFILDLRMVAKESITYASYISNVISRVSQDISVLYSKCYLSIINIIDFHPALYVV